MKALALLLLPACSLSLLGDAEQACNRVEAAVHEYANRCGHAFRGTEPDCSAVTAVDVDEDACERALRSAGCELQTLPSECELEGL